MPRKDKSKAGYESVYLECDQAIQFGDEFRLKEVADKVFDLAFQNRNSTTGKRYMSLFHELDFSLLDLENSSELDNRGEV